MPHYPLASLIFEGLTAFGTVGAVVISLYLLQREKSVTALAEISVSTILVPKDDDDDFRYEPGESFIIVTLSNIGTKPFRINAVGIIDNKTKQEMVILPDYRNPYCTQSDKTFLESDSGQYIFPIQPFIESICNIITFDTHILTRLKYIKFKMTTNLNQCIEVKPSKEFYKDYAELVNKHLDRNKES